MLRARKMVRRRRAPSSRPGPYGSVGAAADQAANDRNPEFISSAGNYLARVGVGAKNAELRPCQPCIVPLLFAGERSICRGK
jgi:hypothetical protein